MKTIISGLLLLSLLACTTRGRGRSGDDDEDAKVKADTTAAADTAGADVPEAPVTEACSKDAPEGVCEGSGLCTDGECVVPVVSIGPLAILEDAWATGAAPAYGGSGNGLADAGEEITLAPSLTNAGSTNFLSVSGTLASSDARVEVLAAEAVYDDLVAGDTKAPESGFRIRIAPDFPAGQLAVLTLAVVDSKEGEIASLPVRVGVRRGVGLGMTAPFVDDDAVGQSEGDGDHAIDPSETIELVLDLQNTGAVDVPVPAIQYDQVGTPLGGQQVEVRLTSASPLVTVQDLDNPPTFAAALAAGATQSSAADFDFAVSGDAVPGEGACLEIAITLRTAVATLYTFQEIRCLTFGGELGPSCSPSAELCNALDDDCDGEVDDDCVSTCGDGHEDPWEACDDDNTEGGDGCSADCLVAEGCGNGVLDPGEECDTEIGGSCPVKAACEAQSDCTTRYAHSGVACQQTCQGKPAAGEACDDADACTTGDKCAGGKCTGTPKTCAAPPKDGCEGQSVVLYGDEPGVCEDGECVFESTKKACKNKCSGGFCSPAVGGAPILQIMTDYRFFAAVDVGGGVGQLVYSGEDGVRVAKLGADGPVGDDGFISDTEGAGIFGVGAGLASGKVEAAYATNTGLMYVATEGEVSYSEGWQSSTVPPNHRDLTAAWTSDGKAHIFLREADTKQLYHHEEGAAWSPTGALGGVTDLGRAHAFGTQAFAPIVTDGDVALFGVSGGSSTTEGVPGGEGGGEPALGLSPAGARYVVFRKDGKLVLATDASGDWKNTQALVLDDNDYGFSVAVNKNGTICVAVANGVLGELAFFLITDAGGAGYLIDDQFQNAVNQERATDLIPGSDGRFYLSWATDDGASLISATIRPDD